jgi:hypothetical protein
VRALLAHPRAARRLSDLAEEVRLSAGHAHRILSGLLEDGFVERHDNNYVVLDPGSLLEAWAQGNRPRRRQISIPIQNHVGDHIEQIMRRGREEVALSGELAAELVHPHLSARSAIVHFLDDDAWERIAEPMRDMPPAPSPSGRLFLDNADEAVAQFGSERHGFRLVHPVQMYVDMYRDRGRARNAAEDLRRRVIQF